LRFLLKYYPKAMANVTRPTLIPKDLGFILPKSEPKKSVTKKPLSKKRPSKKPKKAKKLVSKKKKNASKRARNPKTRKLPWKV
jgi:hypothetical protein